jgi:hypothetical protein
MPHLNLNYGIIIYEDTNENNPQIKVPDISRCIEGVGVNFDKSDRQTIYSNETKTIATTARTLGWDNTTELAFTRFIADNDNMRIKYTGTGTAPAFRTNRNIGGDATTVVTITRVSPYVARISVVSGTAWTLTNVATNDILRFAATTDSFTSPFAVANQGQNLLVQSKGANYIDFVDNGQLALDENITLGTDFAEALLVMSQGSVKVGDTIEISGAGIHPSNQGKFTVADVAPDYIEVTNGLGVEETVLYGTNSLVVYEYLIGFIHLRASGPFKMRFSDQEKWMQVDRLGSGEALFLGSVCTYKIEVFNDAAAPVSLSIQHAMTFSG